MGAKFPTEYELCDRFNVSRHTVREALRALEDQGLLARQAGLGTTVLARIPATHYTSTLDSLGGLHDYATETAFEKQNEGFVTIRGGLAEILGREPGERWLRFAGLRRMVSDGSAICWTEKVAACPLIIASMAESRPTAATAMAKAALIGAAGRAGQESGLA